jgi:hypothetical protein
VTNLDVQTGGMNPITPSSTLDTLIPQITQRLTTMLQTLGMRHPCCRLRTHGLRTPHTGVN